MIGSQAQHKKIPYERSQQEQVALDLSVQELEVDLRNFLLMLWRRKLLILGVMLVSISLVYIFVNTIEPRYNARALIMIQGQADQSPEMRALISSLRVDPTFVLSEAEVLKSRSLARKVVEKFNLMSDPDLNPRLRTTSQKALSDLLGDPDHASMEDQSFKSLNLDTVRLETMPPEVLDQDIGRIVDRFLGNLYARPIPGSSVLQVEFSSTDPKKASLIANAIVDTYIEQRLEAKFESTQKVSDWLDQRLDTLREQVRISESAVEAYRAENNLTVGARAEVTAQQLSELNSQLVLAKSKRAEAEARIEQLEDWLEHPERIEATSEVLNSRLIQNLKLEESALLRVKSDLATRYGEKHPKMVNTKGELEDLRATIRNEMRNIADGLETELEVAQARVSALEDGLSELESLRHVENRASIRLHELEREAESNRMIFDIFLQTYKQSDEKEKLQEPQARVISYATVPAAPSYPNKPLFLSLTAAASFFLGIALSLLIEKLDNAFRTSSQLEAQTGYPCFGIIPAAEKRGKGLLGDYITKNPTSNVAESVRTLRMVLNLRSATQGEKPKVVTITSSVPSEGKTTLSTWLGRLAAKSGEKVLIIDCDLRRPNIDKTIGHKPSKTIVEYLTGDASLEEVIHKDEKSGAYIIYARSVPRDALDLLNSPRMQNLIESARQAYDLVILDSPACLAVSDSRMLATQSDQTLYIVGWDSTPREVVSAGVKQFADFGYETLAFVLTNVDVKRHAKYGYGDSVYYYGRYKEYYTA